MPAEPGSVGQQRSDPLNPPVDRDVINLNPTLDQQLLDIAIGKIEP
jgi:hypothetical protein